VTRIVSFFFILLPLPFRLIIHDTLFYLHCAFLSSLLFNSGEVRRQEGIYLSCPSSGSFPGRFLPVGSISLVKVLSSICNFFSPRWIKADLHPLDPDSLSCRPCTLILSFLLQEVLFFSVCPPAPLCLFFSLGFPFCNELLLRPTRQSPQVYFDSFHLPS